MKFMKENMQWSLPVVLFVIGLFVWHSATTLNNNGLLTVTFLDVGQGDAIFIETPEGTQVLIDGGAGKTILKRLGKVMPFYDRSINIIMATHPDMDHIGGLISVLENYDVDRVLESGVSADTAVYQKFSELIIEEKAEYSVARRGQKIYFDADITMEILFPDRDMSGSKPNTASIIAKLVYGKTSFLLMGDAPASIERYLANLDPDGLDVDVLKVGHHGSKTSTGDELLGLTSPYYAVISAGRDNRYGHPHDKVLEALESFEIKTLRTDQVGNIEIVSDGETISLP